MKMKIQCDVCDKAEASLFCTADEAALCAACDHRVHHANKLASKHQRFSLLTHSSHHCPLCDICQERRALLFCQQDRAILCRDCDLSIHMANEHTKKHNRFLLTGVKLSSSSAVNTASASAASSVSDIPDPKFQPSSKGPRSSGSYDNRLSCPKFWGLASSGLKVNEDVDSGLTAEGGGSTSSISEYLIETLPGWHVEELLEFSAPFGLCKDNESGIPVTSFTAGLSEIWVPEARQKVNYSRFSSQVIGDANKAPSIKSYKRWSDDGFIVPQVSPQSIGKRLRTEIIGRGHLAKKS